MRRALLCSRNARPWTALVGRAQTKGRGTRHLGEQREAVRAQGRARVGKSREQEMGSRNGQMHLVSERKEVRLRRTGESSCLKTLLDKPRGESYHDALPALISTRSELFFRVEQGTKD
jgi:hypothetical protein